MTCKVTAFVTLIGTLVEDPKSCMNNYKVIVMARWNPAGLESTIVGAG